MTAETVVARTAASEWVKGTFIFFGIEHRSLLRSFFEIRISMSQTIIFYIRAAIYSLMTTVNAVGGSNVMILILICLPVPRLGHRGVHFAQIQLDVSRVVKMKSGSMFRSSDYCLECGTKGLLNQIRVSVLSSAEYSCRL